MEYRSVDDLLSVLEGRGLRIRDRALAAHYLYTIGHHRLTAFYRFFYAGEKLFDQEIPASIDDVFHLYSFDRRLRLLILGPLEKLEVALRGLIIKEIGDYLLGRGSGSARIQLFDESLYELGSHKARSVFETAKVECRKSARKSWSVQGVARGRRLPQPEYERLFNAHYQRLPAWQVLQSASFGPLVHIFAVLRPEIARPIADRFGLPQIVLTNLLYALKELRNSCAHHEPIWSWDARQRSVQIRFPKAYAELAGIESANITKLYAYCAVIHILLSYLSNGQSTWHKRLKKLVNEYATLYSTRMGFPENWQTRPFWCVSAVADTEGYLRLRSRLNS